MDEEEFGANLIKWRPLIYRMGLKYRFSGHDLDDYAGDVNLTAWNARCGYDRNKGSFSTWLSRVCITCATRINMAKACQKRKPKTKILRLVNKDGKTFDVANNRESRAWAFEAVESLRPEIERLPRNQRLAIEGFLVGLTQKDIAIREGTARQTIGLAHKNGIQRLRELTQSAALCD